eukprot:SAG31_NODE_21851_length_539_cov_1.047727_1_plen_117_part_01
MAQVTVRRARSGHTKVNRDLLLASIALSMRLPMNLGQLASPEDQCRVCPQTEYKAGNGPGPCNKCPSNSDTAGTGHSSAAACVCLSGFERDRSSASTGPCFEVVSDVGTIAVIAAVS